MVPVNRDKLTEVRDRTRERKTDRGKRARGDKEKDTMSQGHIVQGTHRPRDASSKCRIIQGIDFSRNQKSQTEHLCTHCSGIHRPIKGGGRGQGGGREGREARGRGRGGSVGGGGNEELG
jgi:hypothetical protein